MESNELVEEMLQNVLKERQILDFNLYFSLLSSAEDEFNNYKNAGFSEKKSLELTKSYIETKLPSCISSIDKKPKGTRYLSWITLFFLLFYISTIISYLCGINVWAYCEATSGIAFFFSSVLCVYTCITHKKRKKIDFIVAFLLLASTLSFVIQSFNFCFLSDSSNSFFTMEYGFPGIFYIKKWVREMEFGVTKTLLSTKIYFDASPIVSLISFVVSFFYESARR